MNRHHDRTTGAPGLAGGYCLAELMVALGILAFALPIIGTTFLAGALENKESVESTMGTLLAENALALTRATVRHSDLVNAFGPGKMDQPRWIPRSLLSDTDLAWCPGTREGEETVQGAAQREAKPLLYGCVVAAQRMAKGANDYRLVAVPYRKFTADDEVKSVAVEFDSRGGMTKCEVKLTGATESASIGYFVVRTALRP